MVRLERKLGSGEGRKGEEAATLCLPEQKLKSIVANKKDRHKISTFQLFMAIYKINRIEKLSNRLSELGVAITVASE